MGSPPRAWGKQAPADRWPSSTRFTPTCVGKADSRVPLGSRCGVHPHVRGESLEEEWSRDVAEGSPPRAWGKLAH